MTVPAQILISQGNTQTIYVYGLLDNVTLAYWDAATASASLFDQNGNPTEVVGVSLGYQAGSNGNYVGTVTTTFAMAIGSGYIFKISATQGGKNFYIELPAQVIARTS